jgi:hypothetical protein
MSQSVFHIRIRYYFICTDPALDPDPTLFFRSMALYMRWRWYDLRDILTRIVSRTRICFLIRAKFKVQVHQRDLRLVAKTNNI